MTENDHLWHVASGKPVTSWTRGDDRTGRVVSRHLSGEWLVTVWTYLDDPGRRQVREVDVAPASSLSGRDPWEDLESAANARWSRWDGEPLPTSGLSGRFFRETALGGLLDEQQAAITANDLALAHLSSEASAAVPLTQRYGPGLTEDDLRLIPLVRTAEAYARLVAAGDRHPAKTWAEKSGLSVRTVQDRIRRAREVEPPLLTRGSAGEAGGHLTAEAEDLLRRLRLPGQAMDPACSHHTRSPTTQRRGDPPPF